MELLNTLAFVLLVFYLQNVSDDITSTNTKTQWELWHLHWHTYVLADIFEVRNFRDFRDSFCLFRKCFCSKYITLFWEELSFYLEDKNLFYMIYPNVMHGLRLETRKLFFFEFSIPQGSDIKVFVGIRIVIPENTLHLLKCQGIKN